MCLLQLSRQSLEEMSRCLLSRFVQCQHWTKNAPSSRQLQTTIGLSSSKKDDGCSEDSVPPKTRSVLKPESDLIPPPPPNKSLKSIDSDCVAHQAKNFDVTSDYDNRQGLVKYLNYKPLESSYDANRPIKEPFQRAWDNLTGAKKTKFLKEGFDAFYDIAIIGGGAIGSCVAYFLANRVFKQHKICVIERDPTVSQIKMLLHRDKLKI